MNLGNIKNEFVRKSLGNAGGCWVRSANATSVLCPPPPLHLVFTYADSENETSEKEMAGAVIQPNHFMWDWKL